MIILKRFIKLTLALALFTACNSNDDEHVNYPSYMTQTKSSDIYFIKNTKSRACDVNGNMWTNKPSVISEQEAQEVLAYIATCPDYCDELPNYTRYFIQHVGGAHHKYSYVDHNGAQHNGIDGTSGLENLQVLENSGNWQHVYNFNAGKCHNPQTNNSALMTDGFNGIKAMAEYASSWTDLYRIYFYKGNYYIGLDFYAQKGDGEIPNDGIYDDWVVKIVPETPVTPEDKPGHDEGNGDDNNKDDDNNEEDNDTIIVAFSEGEVEFDIHQQEHKDWNEIKTSIHLRDSINVRVVLPIPSEYIAVPDDFDIRSGEDFNYITERELIEYEVAGQKFQTEVVINHTTEGIEILIEGTMCKEALKVARAVYNDGLTFEIHSYVYALIDDETLWGWLRNTKCAQTSLNKWPVYDEVCTHTYGQVTSAFYQEDKISYDIRP